MVTLGEKYMERAQKALVETLVLSEVRTSPMTIDQIWTNIRGLGWTDVVDKALVEDSVKRLDRDDHIAKEGDRYRITDDGREDLQKIEPVFRGVIDRLGGTMGKPGTTGTMGTAGTTRPGGTR